MELAKETESRYRSIESLYNDSQVIVYAGGIKRAKELLDTTKKNYRIAVLGIQHPYNSKTFEMNQPQGSLLFLGNTNILDNKYFDWDYCLDDNANFLVVDYKDHISQRSSSIKSLEDRIH